jgi:hypothetical protein
MEADGFNLQLIKGAWLSAHLKTGGMVSARLSLVRFLGEDGQVYCVVLLKDRVDADGYRRLRTRLRWKASAAT